MNLSAFDDLDDFDDILGRGDSTLPETPRTIHESNLAALLGISRQTVGEKVRSGVLHRVGRATFSYPEAVTAYCGHLREHASRAGRPSIGGDELKAEKLRLTRAQADAQEAKITRERGELVPADAVSREWAGILRDLRNALLAVPSRCGAGLPHLTSTDIATLDREIRLALEGVAHGN